MGTMPMQLDRPPAQPPAGAPQGGSALPAVAGAFAQRMAPSQPAPGAAPNPQGFILASGDAIRKVIQQMAQANQDFAPFGQRIVAELDAGIAKVVGSQNPPGSPQPPAGDSPATGDNLSAKPPEGSAGRSFPG